MRPPAVVVAVVLLVLAALTLGVLLGGTPRLAGLSRYRKTVVGLLLATATWAVATFPNDQRVQTYGGLVLALLTAAGIYRVPNTPPPGEPADPAMSEQGAGAVAIEGGGMPADYDPPSGALVEPGMRPPPDNGWMK